MFVFNRLTEAWQKAACESGSGDAILGGRHVSEDTNLIRYEIICIMATCLIKIIHVFNYNNA